MWSLWRMSVIIWHIKKQDWTLHHIRYSQPAYTVTCIKRSPFSCPVIEKFICIEPLLRGHTSYKATFSCLKGDLLIQVWLYMSCWWWPLWLWLYGSWINNYLCNQCLSSLKLWVQIPLMARCTWYNIMWWRLWVTCRKSVVFSGYCGFFHQ
jgi:hypothetical protein